MYNYRYDTPRKNGLHSFLITDHTHSLDIFLNQVGCDGFCRKIPDFICFFDDMNEIFLADVHKDQWMYPVHPDPVVPPPKAPPQG